MGREDLSLTESGSFTYLLEIKGVGKVESRLSEVDLLKFQLLSSYLGMATQEVEALATEEKFLALKKMTASQRLQECKEQLIALNRDLSASYGIGPKDTINFVTGEIRREEVQKAQAPRSDSLPGTPGKEAQEGQEASTPVD